MLGFDRIKINKENSLNLHVDIDQDYILETESKTGINYIRVGYLTIGQKANLVCEECGNFIFQNKCIDSCP